MIRSARNGRAFLEVESAILNWTILGLFTGSRIAEYGQGKKRKHEPFSMVPRFELAGQWAGTLITFMRSERLRTLR